MYNISIYYYAKIHNLSSNQPCISVSNGSILESFLL